MSSPESRSMVPWDGFLKKLGMDDSLLETCLDIFSVIQRYGSRPVEVSGLQSHGLKCISLIYSQVKAGSPIEMCLPAFPFKSPNAEQKVLGHLPDKGEEFALAHLQGLCAAISDVYPYGAKLLIISDGIVYNDLLSVPDNYVWLYGQELRELAVAKGYQDLEFTWLKDLVPLDLPHNIDEVTYVANATNVRRALLNNFSDPCWDTANRFTQDEGVCLIYRSHIECLESDLSNVYPVGESFTKSTFNKGIEIIGKEMLLRSDAFARAVRQKFPNHIHLSTPQYIGESEISISLLPTDTSFTTPWQSSIAFKLDGSVTTGPAVQFREDPLFELIYENGRPSYFREKTDLLDWLHSPLNCEPVYPCGWMLQPAAGPNSLSMQDIDAVKVRALAEINSPIILRGFAQSRNRDLFLEKAKELGTPLEWKFGLILEVKDRGADTGGLNNVLSAEWMPFHFDGLFKVVKKTAGDGSEIIVPLPPRQVRSISGITITPSPKDTGFTLFACSTQFFKHLPTHTTLDHLKLLTWSVSTSSFDQTKMHSLPLVALHPSTGYPCLRYHEPWPEYRTKFDATEVTIDNLKKEDGEAICQTIDSLLHDRRVAYYHSWEKGDLIVNDNTLAMHTRSDYKGSSDRELWRIHFD